MGYEGKYPRTGLRSMGLQGSAGAMLRCAGLCLNITMKKRWLRSLP